MNSINVLLAEDHQIVREGLRAMLNLEPDIKVIGEAENGRQAVELVAKIRPDVIVMDIAMPLLNGLDAIARIRECTPSSTKIIVLSSYDEEAYIQQARALGASGYLVKQSDSLILARAIREVHQGHEFFKPIQHSSVQIP